MERAFLKTAPRLADELPKVMAEKLDQLIEKENRTYNLAPPDAPWV
jgi:hypothetical protein